MFSQFFSFPAEADTAGGRVLSLGLGGNVRDSPSRVSVDPVLSESALLKMASGGETARGIGAGVVGIVTSALDMTPNPCWAIESK